MVERSSLTAVTTVLMIASAAAAEPPKAPPVKHPQPTQPTNPPTQIVLASAEGVQAPAPDGSTTAPEPKRRIVPRVTHCRCGDPQVVPETQEQ